MGDLPKRQVARISAPCVVLEIAMATVGNAGSTTAIIIAFSLESILSRVCLVDYRGLLVRGVRASAHAALCPLWPIFSCRARMRADSSEFRAAL